MSATACGSIGLRALMGLTERSAKSENVGAHEHEPGNVGGLERARKAARQAGRAATRAESLEPRDVEMHQETAATLVARVEHRALEAQRGQIGKKSEVRIFVGEQYADESDLARRKLQGIAETSERRAVDRELEVVRANRRQPARPRQGACSR